MGKRGTESVASCPGEGSGRRWAVVGVAEGGEGDEREDGGREGEGVWGGIGSS